MLVYCWSSVVDDGPTINHNWPSISWIPGTHSLSIICSFAHLHHNIITFLSLGPPPPSLPCCFPPRTLPQVATTADLKLVQHPRRWASVKPTSCSSRPPYPLLTIICGLIPSDCMFILEVDINYSCIHVPPFLRPSPPPSSHVFPASFNLFQSPLNFLCSPLLLSNPYVSHVPNQRQTSIQWRCHYLSTIVAWFKHNLFDIKCKNRSNKEIKNICYFALSH